RMANGLEGAGHHTHALGQLGKRSYQILRGVREDATQRLQLVRLYRVEEPGQEPLQNGLVDVRRALRRQDQAQAIVAPNAGDLAQHLSGDGRVVRWRDEVELVDRQDDERQLFRARELLQVPSNRGGDEA